MGCFQGNWYALPPSPHLSFITSLPLSHPHPLFLLSYPVRHEGPKVLWSGLMPSMIGLIHVAIQFPLYEEFKSIAQSRSMLPPPSPSPSSSPSPFPSLTLSLYLSLFLSPSEASKETPLTWTELFLCAAGSKLFASAAAYPHEVIRSRLQGQGGMGEKKYPIKRERGRRGRGGRRREERGRERERERERGGLILSSHSPMCEFSFAFPSPPPLPPLLLLQRLK